MLRFFGEAVVKACVDNGASHIDISGEPQVNQSSYHVPDKLVVLNDQVQIPCLFFAVSIY